MIDNEKEFFDWQLQTTKEAIDKAHRMGFNQACENIITAVKLVHTNTISIEHVVKMVGIIQKIYNDKK